ncbi:3-oxoacyl-[acyl-carrier-protein] synthase III C-terminal domain-containing protein [Sphingomonas sp. MMS24-JH45]
MKGRQAFRHAVVNLRLVMQEALKGIDLTPADVDGWCRTKPMPASSSATARKLSLPAERVVVTVDRHANTSAASVPLALNTAVRRSHQAGQIVVLEAMGGGFTWGAAVDEFIHKPVGDG